MAAVSIRVACAWACLAALLLPALCRAHEIRPAYLQITENNQHHFDVLWKQPAMGKIAARLVPEVSNGLLDATPAEESASNSFVLRRWNDRPGKAPVETYLTLGIEHILTGFDHLSFVLGLVLLVRGRAMLLKTITAFTIAHSITLAAAALGYVNVSG